ncbi:FecR family protein [Olivibacter sp. XZL3]|uniref:FecR family protein n=1 Tax=Olivibacter sp. XZL3 TaxID=1735116 RepID=UPI001064B161|nr:FecR domain-containing protein [Olivibacter sp. XZL3]
MSIQQIKNLYLKFIKGECTRREIDLLVKLLQSTEHEAGLPTVEEIKRLDQEAVLDEEASDDIFHAIITSDQGREESKFPGSTWKSMLVVAASIIVLFAIGILAHSLLSPTKTIYRADFAEKKTVMLPDGTKVLLNANTQIETHQHFLNQDKREIWITGEAFFDVAPDKKRPFIVYTSKGLEVRVLGTAFNLKAREAETHVVLNRGSVQVAIRNTAKEAAMLVPGEMAMLNMEEKTLIKRPVDTLDYAAWQYDLLPFKNESLAKIAHVLKEIYGYDVVFGKTGLEKRHFTGSLPSNDIDKAIKTLSAALNCEITIHDNKKININQQINN